MVTTARTRFRTSAAVVGGGLALALALSACGSDADPMQGSGSAGSVSDVATPSATGTPAAEPTTSAPQSSSAASSAPAASGASLPSLLLNKSDLPSSYDQGGTSELNGALLNERLRTCTGVGSPSDDTIVDSLTSPSYSFAGSGAASTVTRYETQAAADADAKLLSAPKAGPCFRSVLLKQFNSSGGTASSATVTVRPGTNNGPSNEVGIARLSFVEDQGREGRPTIRVALYYLAGPRTLSTLVLFSFGNPFDQALSTKLLYTIAKRTAGA